MFVRVYDVTYIKIEPNHGKLRNFISSLKMYKNTTKLYRFFLHKSYKKKNSKKIRWEMFCTFECMTSLELNSKLYKFLTSTNLIKTPQNFVQDSFSMQLRKICHKNRVEFFASGPLQVCYTHSF